AGSELRRHAATGAIGSPGVATRWVDPTERRDYLHPPRFKVWPGPQWNWFEESARSTFFTGPWRISSRSDRTGYRLDGDPLQVLAKSLVSEPVLPGSIQIPP